MLVLSRKVDEKIWIGDDICITVVHIERGKVRIGIQAPKELSIYREEVREFYINKTEETKEESGD